MLVVFLFVFNLCVFIFMAGLHCFAWAFSSCSELGPLPRCGAWVLTAVISLAMEHGRWTHRLQ